MYLKVIKDIIENYTIYLTKEELINLSNISKTIKDINDEDIDNNTIIFINSILNKIWNNTLTNINSFKNGDNFCFLVKNKERYFDTYFKDTNKSKIGLLKNTDIIDFDITISGYIIKLNYNGNIKTTPLLPIYFDECFIDVKNFNYDILATYSIDTKLDKYDCLIKEAKEEGKKLNIPYILLDKMLYRKQNNEIILIENDLIEITRIFYANYCHEYNKDPMFTIRNKKWLLNKKIHKLILDYYIDNKTSLYELQDNIFKIFKKLDENLTTKKRK